MVAPGSGSLILIRHGESAGNQARCFNPDPHVDLTEKGVAQAHAVGRELSERFAPVRVIASSYRRARRTAEIICREIEFGGDLEVEDELRERQIGQLAGQPYASMRAHPEYDPARFWEWQPPGGESLEQVQRRAFPVLDRILSDQVRPRGGDTVIVSHGGVMLSLCAAFESGWKRPNVARNCEMVVVTRSVAGEWSLETIPRAAFGARETISAEETG